MNFTAFGTTALLMLLLNGTILSNESLPLESLGVCYTESNSSAAADYLVLRALYLSTNGDNWDPVLGWLSEADFLLNPTMPSGTDLGLWTGVTLSPAGVVERLDLQGQNLIGTLPIEIGDFCAIEELVLFSNTLLGPIPNSITNLSNLTYLNLGSNQLSGSIPSGFSTIPNLDKLNLQDNKLSGSIPADIGAIDSLTYLRLSNNKLVGEIPSTLGNLSNLKNLLIQENKLSGTIPDVLGNLTNLTQFFLYSNLLTGRIPASLGNLNLNSLWLSDNDLYGCFDANLLNLCNIGTNTNFFISDGNKFCTPWEDFCTSQIGLCGSTTNDDAYCSCETSINLAENPEPNRIERASFNISSTDVVDYAENSTYTAGNQVVLKNGFEVQQGSELHAYIETCEEDCTVSSPCESPSSCEEVDFELDSEGNKYVPNQVTVVFHGSTAGINGDVVKNYLDNYLFNNGYVLDTISIDYADFKQATSIESCLCGHPIYLYSVDPMYQINEEGGVIGANADGAPSEEGQTYSLNHFIDAGLMNEDAPDVVSNSPVFNQNALSTDTTVTTVAFLDSGVNPGILPSSSLLPPVPYSCSFTTPRDTFGWNFIDGNKDVLDRRGHGTAVYQSYLYGLSKLGLDATNQNSLIVKVLDDCGKGTAYAAACGIFYAADRGADVINMSWGLYTNNVLIQEAIDSVTTVQGILISSSSGNSGQDLENKEHFPSGYGYPHFKVINSETGQTTLSSIPNVFEVGGLCRSIKEPGCVEMNDEVSFWSSANYRSGQAIFAEPAIEIQTVIDTSIQCGIAGTSYAAPQFTAALVNEIIVVGFEGVTKSNMFNKSVSWTGNGTNFSYYSYILENQTCISNLQSVQSR